MFTSVYFECCDSDVDWRSSEWYLRGCTYVISMCLLCITEIIFLCTFSTTLLEKDNVNVDIFCCICLCAIEREW